jgi:hypothetical protein
MAKATPTLSSIDLLPTVEYPPPPTLEQELAKALDDTAEITAAPRAHKPRKQSRRRQ